jgi:mannose-1-phosphate guanylyltransferase
MLPGRSSHSGRSRPEPVLRTALINAGLYVLEPDALDLVPPGKAVSIERDVFPQLAKNGTLFATELPGLLIDMGTPEGYLDAHAELLAAGPRRTYTRTRRWRRMPS